MVKRGLAAGLGLVKGLAAAVASAFAKIAKLCLSAERGFVEGLAAALTSMTEGEASNMVKMALLVAGAAVVVYFLRTAAAAATVGTMSAPGAPGFVVSRAAFVANPKLYFHLLRTAGAKAAAASFLANPKLYFHPLLTAGAKVVTAFV
ncbi:hypothetical protein ABZP36_001046 [Zizania latifolia]